MTLAASGRPCWRRIQHSVWLSGWMSLDYISVSAEMWSGTHKRSWWGLVWQSPRFVCVCVCLCLHGFFCQYRLHFWLCKYVPSCRQTGFLACIALYSSVAKALLVSKSKNSVTLKTSDLSPRLALPPTVCVSSVRKITRRQQRRTEDAYRPSSPPRGLGSWALSHWSSCFSPRTCSSQRPRLRLWRCTSCPSSERQSGERLAAGSCVVRWKPMHIWSLNKQIKTRPWIVDIET